MTKIVTTTEFYSDKDIDFSFVVNEKGLMEGSSEYGCEYLELDEIPEFIAWLQAEYDKQKAGN